MILKCLGPHTIYLTLAPQLAITPPYYTFLIKILTPLLIIPPFIRFQRVHSFVQLILSILETGTK